MRQHVTLTAVAAVALLGLALPAAAQDVKKADQLIQLLKPKGGVPIGPSAGINHLPAATAPAATQAAASPGAAAPARAVTAAAKGGAPSVDLNVEFRTGSAELTPAAMRALDELGKAVSSADLAAYRFRIEGHTDTVGTPAVNQTLSDARAKAVAEYLQQRFSVAPARLEPVGLGEAGLRVATPPQTPEARNRRVQIVNIGA